MNGAGVGCQQRTRGDGALGHPGAVVEQARGLVERLDIDLDDLAAEPRQPLERVVVAGLELPVAEEQPLAGSGTPSFTCGGMAPGVPSGRLRE